MLHLNVDPDLGRSYYGLRLKGSGFNPQEKVTTDANNFIQCESTGELFVNPFH
jgi:hypothetical protein